MEENRPEDKHAANGSTAGQHAGGDGQPAKEPSPRPHDDAGTRHEPQQGASPGGAPAEHHGAAEIVETAVRTVKSIAHSLLEPKAPPAAKPKKPAKAKAKVKAKAKAAPAKKAKAAAKKGAAKKKKGKSVKAKSRGSARGAGRGKKKGARAPARRKKAKRG
jgi:hypothetical protein